MVNAQRSKRLVFRRRAEGAQWVLAFAAGMAFATLACLFLLPNGPRQMPSSFLAAFPISSAILFAFYALLVSGQPGLVVDLDAGEVRDLPGLLGKGRGRRWLLARFTGVSLRYESSSDDLVVALLGRQGLQVELPRRASARKAWRDYVGLGVALSLPLSDYTVEPPVHVSAAEITTPLWERFGTVSESVSNLLAQLGPPPERVSVQFLHGGRVKFLLRPDPTKKPRWREVAALLTTSVGVIAWGGFSLYRAKGRWDDYVEGPQFDIALTALLLTACWWVTVLGRLLPTRIVVGEQRVHVRHGPWIPPFFWDSLPNAEVTNVLRQRRGGFAILSRRREIRFPLPPFVESPTLPEDAERWLQEALIASIATLASRREQAR